MNNGYYQQYPNNMSNNDYEIYTNDKEELYLENILKLNKGKMVKINITIPCSIEWQD